MEKEISMEADNSDTSAYNLREKATCLVKSHERSQS